MEMQAKFNRRIDDIQRRLRECNFECNELKELFSQTVSQFQTQLEIRLAAPEPVEEAAVEEVIEPVVSVDAPVETPVEEVVESPAPVVASPPPLPVQTPVVAAAAPSADRPQNPKTKTPPSKTTTTPRPKRNMEKFIGENLLNKIGIGILVIGVGIFVKYAIDQDWIGSIGRVLIGFLTGGLLLGIAHRLRNSYKSFSSVLVGGGIATLYFTVAIAFQTYDLLTQPVAFALMCGITAFGVLMSTAYNRLEIAIIALVGGFATPFMVARGEGNYVALFSYLLVLNIGALALSWFRDWKAVRVLAYAFTTLLFGSWMAFEYIEHHSIPMGGIGFATAFFVVFFLSNIAFAVRKQQSLKSFDFLLLLSNSALYYGAVMGILYQVDAGRYMGLFTALVGVFHFLFVIPAKKYVAFDKRLVSTLVGLVLTFVTASVVIQLEGRHAATFWALEAVVLLLLARRTKLKVMESGSLVVSLLAVLALGRNWMMAYADHSMHVQFWNGMLLTTVVSGAAMIALYFLHKRKGSNLDKLYRTLGLGILFIGVGLQLNKSLQFAYDDRVVAIGLVSYIVYFMVALSVWARVSKEKEFGTFVFVLSKLTFAVFVATQVLFFASLRHAYGLGYDSGSAFPLHLLMVPGLFALLALNFAHGRRFFGKDDDSMSKLLTWVTTGLFILLCSIELDNLLVMSGVELKFSRKIGYPILWGAIGFGLVALGLKLRQVHIRIAGLSLFLLIILKLFAYDVWTMPTGGKIAAFISLGVLLLIASFMYQRLKRLLVNEEQAPAA